MNPRISLDQWRAFTAVVEAGGYAQAAERLNKSQSTVSYAVRRIEDLLDVRLFELVGRKAELTSTGRVLHRRAALLLERAGSLERGAACFAADWEPEVAIAVETLYPTWLLLRTLERFATEQPETRIQLHETVLGGGDEMLAQRKVAFAVTPHVPPGLEGISLYPLRAIPAAHPDHPLHHLGREVTFDDLAEHRQLVVRDSAVRDRRESGGWLGAEQRWTFSHKATQIAAASMGLGFAWFAEFTIRRELEAGVLKPLPLAGGGERFVHIYLVFSDPENTGRAAARLAEILREDVAGFCRESGDMVVLPG